MSVPIRILKPLVFLLCLGPVGYIVYAIAFLPADAFGANPQSALTDMTGDWTLRFVLLTLAITPLRLLTGWNSAVRYRRMLGLFAFFYSFLHFLTYVWFTENFIVGDIAADVVKRSFITVGFLGFLLMIPLAITSTKKWISRLGGKRWQRLHMAVYITGILGVIHYIWRVKSDIQRPLIYAVLLAFLLGFRLWNKYRTAPVVR